MMIEIGKTEDKNWWDNKISYEDIVYDHLLSYGSFENVSDDVIEFASRLMKTTYEKLYNYLEREYDKK